MLYAIERIRQSRSVVRNGLQVGATRTSDARKNNSAMAKCIGNGQVNQLYLSDIVGALNCMHDKQMIIGGVKTRTMNI